MKSMQKEKGFTIIEVVLVLAIAGLIFLIVFLAVPALQRGQRDTARKQDLSRLVAGVQSFQSNNRNAIPNFADTTTALPAFLNSYLRQGSTFTDPNGTDYTFVTTAPTANHTIQYAVGSVCAGTEGTLTGGQGSRKVAFVMDLEGSGLYCQNN